MNKIIAPNCEASPANISLRLVGGVTTYKVFGYVLTPCEGVIEVYRWKDRAKVMRVPTENIKSLEAEF
jgi:hypothetical protein